MSTPRPVRSSFLATQLSLLFLLISGVGFFSSAPVFTVPIADAARPPGSLDHAWPLGLSLSVAGASALLIPSAAFFHASTSHTKAARLLARSAAASHLFVFLAPLGVALSNRALVFLGGLMLALPLAMISSFSMQHTAELVPDHFGLAVGICSVVIGIGLVFMTWFNNALLNLTHSVTTALCIYVAWLTVNTFLPSLGITFRSEAETHGATSPEGQLSEGTRLVASPDATQDDGRLSFRDAVRSRSVWLFVLCIACKRIVTPVMPYFFDMGNMYGASHDTLTAWFQAGTVISVVSNLVLSSASDFVRTSSGMFRSGGRNILAFTLCLQTCAFVVLYSLPYGKEMFRAWAVAITVLRVTSQSHFNMAMIIAKDVFGTPNMALIAGSANGLATAAGASFSTAIMALVVRHSTSISDPSLFVPFYKAGIVLSTIAFVLLCGLRKR